MTTVTEAPAAAVAGDAHWAAKMARLRARRPQSRVLDIRCDDDAVTAARQARSAVAAAERAAAAQDRGSVDADPQVVAARADLEQAEAALADTTVSLLLQGLPRDVYEALIAEHPATEDGEELGQNYDPETFAPALVSACSLDGMPPADAAELLTSLSQLEAGMLFQTCIGLCESARIDIGSQGNV